MITKLFEIVLLQRLTPLLEEVGFPDFSQTAYQKGISCSDAIFATQEALLTHARDNGKPFLCFYDVEKAFDSVELPILLKELWAIGKWKAMAHSEKLVHSFLWQSKNPKPHLKFSPNIPWRKTRVCTLTHFLSHSDRCSSKTHERKQLWAFCQGNLYRCCHSCG